MDDACCSGPVEQAADPRARPALWVALGLNALMCVVELGAAALGVFGTASACPDLLVAGVMAALAVGAAASVLRQARRELRGAASADR